LSLKGVVVLRDTPVTPYTRLPISTNLAIRRPTIR